MFSQFAWKWLGGIALCASLASPAIPSLASITWFAPSLCSSIYRVSFTRFVWLSFASGLLLDLLADTGHLGLYAAAASVASYAVFRVKRQLFADEWSTLPLLTALYSLCLHGAYFILFHTLERPLPVSIQGALALVGIHATVDALYALACVGIALGVGALKRAPATRFERPRPQ